MWSAIMNVNKSFHLHFLVLKYMYQFLKYFHQPLNSFVCLAPLGREQKLPQNTKQVGGNSVYPVKRTFNFSITYSKEKILWEEILN